MKNRYLSGLFDLVTTLAMIGSLILLGLVLIEVGRSIGCFGNIHQEHGKPSLVFEAATDPELPAACHCTMRSSEPAGKSEPKSESPSVPNALQPSTVTFPDGPCTVAGGVKGHVFLAPAQFSVTTLPVESTVVVKDNRGVVFARTKTDKYGKFSVPVPPGIYTVEVTPIAEWLPPAVARLTVKVDQYTGMDVFYKK